MLIIILKWMQSGQIYYDFSVGFYCIKCAASTGTCDFRHICNLLYTGLPYLYVYMHKTYIISWSYVYWWWIALVNTSWNWIQWHWRHRIHTYARSTIAHAGAQFKREKQRGPGCMVRVHLSIGFLLNSLCILNWW